MKKILLILFGFALLINIQGQRFPFYVAPSVAGGSPSFDSTDLLYYYKLDESNGDALDAHGNTDLTVGGTPTRGVTGILNTCYTFDGTDDRAQSSTQYTFDVFTISAWVWPDNTSSNRSIVSQGSSSMQFRISGSDHLDLLDATVTLIGSSSGTISTTTWTHVAVTYDVSGNYIFYINGSSSGSGTGHETFTLAQFSIGRQGSNDDEYFAGEIDEVAIYDVVKSPSVISDLYNSGNGLAYPY